jgi:L-ascorbate metabolism protein UlaG (beta-lactamase superfamily)
MILRRLDDYQGWQVLHRGRSLLIDPWLTAEPIRGIFDRVHPPGFVTFGMLRDDRAELSAVLLCSGVNDHLRPETIELLSEVPVYGPPAAAKAARALGASATVRRPGDVLEIACAEGSRLRVTALRTGRALSPVAIAYSIEAFDGEQILGRIWIDPHLPTAAIARHLAPVSLALLPTEAVRAGLLTVTAGPRRSAEAAAAARARVVVPTATDPSRDMTTWQRRLLRVTGGVADLRSRLADTPTELVVLGPAAELEIPPDPRLG